MPSSEARKPWVIAHRGASGLRPEHTLEAYALAIEQGADFIEPDLVPTKDGILIARHENEISRTTNVADRPEFADRRSGRRSPGWFTEDFTLAELKSLRAREPLPHLRPESAVFDDQFELVTLDEIVALADIRSKMLGREIGVVAELKHAPYFHEIGLPFEDLLLPLIERHNLGRDSPFFVEAFDSGILQRLRPRTNVRLVQLEQQQAAPHWLAAMATYADAVAPHKSLVIPREEEGGRSLPPTNLVDRAHAAGLLVFAWTFRSENLFLPAELRRGDDASCHGDAAAEYRAFFDLGVDAVFSDFPADAVAARQKHPSLRGA